MSQELADACDKLISTTSILSHTFGVPKVTRSNSKTNIIINRLEQQYVNVYQELTNKLRELIYLNELNTVGKLKEKEINDKYEEIKRVYPMIESDNLESFLQLHNTKVQNESLLNHYIQLTGPILRSIHQDNKALTSTELNILHNLEKMYSLDNGLVFKLMNKIEEGKQSEQEYYTLVANIEKLLREDLKPKLNSLGESNNKLLQLNKQLVESKEVQIDKLDPELDTSIGNEIKSIYKDLVAQWNLLSKYSNFLPMLITSLPINWFEDKTLYNILRNCEDYAEKLEKYQLLVNIETINDFRLKDLLMLDFEEFKLINDDL
ncbi:uncharacterized protein RJT21DRAFT_34108 [Scheffersomyces amazonensis]|uniref:uncharacterized protein n=1 Tax=Scheffersomyces amazonensis TaxID=1078765 RepID=UPI00315CEF4E